MLITIDGKKVGMAILIFIVFFVGVVLGMVLGVGLSLVIPTFSIKGKGSEESIAKG